MNQRKFKKLLKRISNLPTNKFLFLYGINKIKHFYYKLTKSTKVAYPSTIMLELTNHCNLACTICPRVYDYGKNMDKGIMTVEQAKKIIDEVVPYLDSIGLTGMGETFLYNHLEEIINYLKNKNKGVIITLSTNAVVPDFIKKVSPLINKVDTIQISIDGINEVYESIRINSNFNLLDNNLKQLVELSKNSTTDLMLNMVVTKENYIHIPDLVKYASKTGIRYLDFTLLNLASVTDIDRDYYKFYSSGEFLSVLRELDDIAKQFPEVLITNRNFKTENSFQKCPFPWTHFYICCNGLVTPCCAKPFPKEYNFGNVLEKGVMSVLNSDKFRDFRTLWLKNEAPRFCNKCHFLDIEPIKK